MATVVTKEFRFDNTQTAYAYDSRDMNVFNKDSCFVRVYLNAHADDYIYLYQSGRDLLFPTATAKPFLLVHSMRYRRTLGGTGHFYFYIDGTELHHCSTTSSSYTTNEVTLTSSAVTNCTSASEFKWYIKINSTTQAACLLWDKFIFSFYLYTCSATAGTGVSSASVSNASPYSGETVTFSCLTIEGYTFDGWYNGSTKVSSDKTFTCNAADLPLTAKAKKSAFYIKVNNAWRGVLLYQKVNGSWQKITTQPTGYSSGDLLLSRHNFSYNDILNKGEGLTSENLWMTTDYLEIAPNTDLTVQASQNSLGNMFNIYYEDKTYYDWWSHGSGSPVATVDGVDIYNRVLSASQVVNCHYVRVNIYKPAYQYLKIWSGSKLIFDGSLVDLE